jgi:hypothetical protein
LAFSAAKTAEKVYNESLGIIPVKNVIPVSPQAREYREKECPVCHIIHKGRGDHCSRACSVIGSARTHERNGSYQKRGEAVTKTRSESLEMPYRDARLGTNLEFLAAEDYSVAIPNFPEIPDGYMLNEFE